MNRQHVLTLTVLFQVASMAMAQEMPQAPKPTKEHRWLQKFVGTWEVSSAGVAAEGQPAIQSTGKIESTRLGEFWVQNRMEAEFGPGMAFSGIQTVGYDAKKKKYIGTWIDSTNGFMWKYEGFVKGEKLVLEATGPDMTNPEKTRLYRDSYEFTGENSMKVESSMQAEDGSWTVFMTGKGKRTKTPAKTK